MKKQNLIVIGTLLLLIVSCSGKNEEEITVCDCKQNFWDPEDKKYGDVMVLENTGKLAGKNLVHRNEMMNHYHNMVSFEKLTPEDKVIRKECLNKYPNHQEVIQNCK
jgi:hypothetical protein